ncbi:universal stress protein [Xanthomarina spongicola]|uniref:Nucleotide-binding universal stress UspA family protein n=1 Tax=Xanthomarina spongicola TaxID=570520 RepID=A0A316DSA8_9FLAO|nr:universal stress protein [Xanthomarina spongicola]PWK20686.1 nucleotide-binding universal stress UspA family protein [Xanthomarina spongicola]
MKRKILLPTDFSNNSWLAINYALQLYKNETCDFYLLNAFLGTNSLIENIMNLGTDSEFFEEAKTESQDNLSKLLDKLIIKEHGDPKHTFKTISVFNNPIDAIKDIVEQKDIEIVIMGTKGKSSDKSTVFGSVAVNAMEKVRNCPVIVVPENAKQSLPKEIVFPTSYETHYKRRELSYLTDISKKCDATIAILHVSEENELNENQKERKQLLQEIFEGVKYTFHSISHDTVESAVNIFVESRDSDMVAFINKKHNFFGSILTKPMVKGIAFHSKVPILVMHDLRN